MPTAGRLAALLLVQALMGCAAPPFAPADASACAQDEASYACQVERYHNVNV